MEQHAPATIHGERHLTDRAEADAYLQDVAARLRSANITTATHVQYAMAQTTWRRVSWPTATNLPSIWWCSARTAAAACVGMLYGRIAQQVLHRGGSPILLIAPTDTGAAPPFDPRVILVPLDGTLAHEPALPIAAAITRAFGAELHPDHGGADADDVARRACRGGRLLPTTMRAVLDLARQGGSDYLEQVAARCRAGGLAVVTDVLRGDTVPVVLACSRRSDADLLVLATHGRAGIDAILAGSVAPRVTERARCPLLLVHAGDGSAGNSLATRPQY